MPTPRNCGVAFGFPLKTTRGTLKKKSQAHEKTKRSKTCGELLLKSVGMNRKRILMSSSGAVKNVKVCIEPAEIWGVGTCTLNGPL